MTEVIPLKYGAMFKRVFGKPEIFQRFASAVLGIPITVEDVHTEYEYPEKVGFVQPRYDLFAEDVTQRLIVEIQQVKEADFFDRFLYYHLISMIEQVKGFKAYCFQRTVYTVVVLTSVPEDRSVNFAYASGYLHVTDERGQEVPVYPHRIVFLVPRLVNEHTPAKIAMWLEFIKDSLDGRMDANDYSEDFFKSMIEEMQSSTVLSPEELAAMKDDAAWEIAKEQFIAEGRAEDIAEGKAKAKAEGMAEGRAKGMAEGKAEGMAEARSAMITSMLAHGMSVEQIATITGIAVTEVQANLTAQVRIK